MLLETRGGPYRPTHQSAGEVPAIIPDVPLSAVLLVVFIFLGASNLFLFLRNKKRGILFVFNGAAFGLCNIRLATFCLRMGWATHPHNLHVGIAAGVFFNAGTIILFIVNLFFAQRVVRAQHPTIGWGRVVSMIPAAGIFMGVTTLIMLIVSIVQSFYTRDESILAKDRSLLLYGQTVFMIIAFLPIPMVLISTAAGQLASVKARREQMPVDKFGRGRLRHKVMLVLFSAAMLCIEEGYRCGTTWMPLVPLDHPQPWYFTKAAYYTFNFVPEVSVVLSWLVFRIDLMFHVPNGSKGTYQEEQREAKDSGSESA